MPDLRSRLICSKRVSRQQWKQLTASGGPRGSLGALLIGRGLLTRPELRRLLWSMVLDALLALTVPLVNEPVVARARFTMGRSHWAETVLSLEVGSVLAELEQTAGLAGQNVPAGGRPQLRDGRPITVLEREQWALACRCNGIVTVQDLAWRSGFALHDTMEWVGQLVRAGLCTIASPGPPALPRRVPGAALPGRDAQQGRCLRGQLARSRAAPAGAGRAPAPGLAQRRTQSVTYMPRKCRFATRVK